MGEVDPAIDAFSLALRNASSNSTAIFLGDNIYPIGFTNKKGDKELAEHRLKVQTDAVKDFDGETIFIPGNHDWYSGLKGLKRQEKFVEDALGKNTFLPENGCPIQKVNIAVALLYNLSPQYQRKQISILGFHCAYMNLSNSMTQCRNNGYPLHRIPNLQP